MEVKSFSLLQRIFLIVICFVFSNTFTQEITGIKSGYIEDEKGKIYYEVAGEGEYYVMVHDGSFHSVTWNKQFPVFANPPASPRGFFSRGGWAPSAGPGLHCRCS